MRAIVLSGGGGKGAYQIGVWRALRKLNISYDMVVGTSVGSLNGALMVQHDYLKAIWMWYNIDFNQIYDVELKNQYGTKEGNKEIFNMYKQNIFKNGGMKTNRLEKLIEKSINIRKFYKSKIDFGLVTFNLSNFKPVTLTKKDIKKEQLKDYLIASSSCYPAFQLKDIDGDKFIDGGFYDNLPINLASSMQADEIIAVDLDSLGLKRIVKKNGVKITYIKPRNKINSFLVFNRLESRRAMRLGYNDAMKIYGKLDGNKYTFKIHHLHKNYDQIKALLIDTLNKIISADKKNLTLIDELFSIARIGKLKNNTTDKKMMEETNKTMEYLGRMFGLDDSKIYTTSKFNEILFANIMSTEEMGRELIESKIKSNKIKELLNTKFIVKYLYNRIINLTLDNKKELYRLSILFPKEFMAALYLSVI